MTLYNYNEHLDSLTPPKGNNNQHQATLQWQNLNEQSGSGPMAPKHVGPMKRMLCFAVHKTNIISKKTCALTHGYRAASSTNETAQCLGGGHKMCPSSGCYWKPHLHVQAAMQKRSGTPTSLRPKILCVVEGRKCRPQRLRICFSIATYGIQHLLQQYFKIL